MLGLDANLRIPFPQYVLNTSSVWIWCLVLYTLLGSDLGRFLHGLYHWTLYLSSTATAENVADETRTYGPHSHAGLS